MKIQNLSSTDFKSQFEADPDAILLDVRTIGEYQYNALPNAINIDIKRPDFIDEIDELDREKAYYVYCRIGIRSANACRLMQQMGFRSVYNWEKGLEG